MINTLCIFDITRCADILSPDGRFPLHDSMARSSVIARLGAGLANPGAATRMD